MDYQTLYTNDNGTTKVRMTYGEKVLEQDIPNGDDLTEFKNNIKQAMAVFKKEYDTRQELVDSFIPDDNLSGTFTSLPDVED